MKDITKGDILSALDTLPSTIKAQRRRIAQMMIKEVENWEGGCGGVSYETQDGKLSISIRVQRAPEYRRELRGKS